MAEMFGSYPEESKTASRSEEDTEIGRKEIKKLIKCVQKLRKEEKIRRKLLQKEQQQKMKEISEENVCNEQKTSTDKGGEKYDSTSGTQKRHS